MYLNQDNYVNQYPNLVNELRFDPSSGTISEVVIQLMNIVGAESKTFIDIGCGRSGGNSEILANKFS